mgnify:CR=1 FL=1
MTIPKTIKQNGKTYTFELGTSTKLDMYNAKDMLKSRGFSVITKTGRDEYKYRIYVRR